MVWRRWKRAAEGSSTPALTGCWCSDSDQQQSGGCLASGRAYCAGPAAIVEESLNSSGCWCRSWCQVHDSCVHAVVLVACGRLWCSRCVSHAAAKGCQSRLQSLQTKGALSEGALCLHSSRVRDERCKRGVDRGVKCTTRACMQWSWWSRW